MKKSLYWIRNDHRLHDNLALRTYCQSREGLIVWSKTPTLLRAGPRRWQFYLESLNSFVRSLQENNQHVLMTEESIEVFLKKQILPMQIETLIYSKEVGTEEEAIENRVLEFATQNGIRVVSFYQDTLLDRDDVSVLFKTLPRTFTDFRKKIEATLNVRPPQPPPSSWPKPLECSLPSWNAAKQSVSFSIPAQPGEAQALQRLQNYFWVLDRARTYKDTRNGMLDWNDSTKFSLWLANGSLSPRMIYQELRAYEDKVVKNESTYWIFFELLWRDYFKFYLQQEGASLFLRKNKMISSYKEAQSLFQSWCEGRTGDAFIDANMRELLQTGWMSNRGRQNVASFLAKKWQLPWRWGAEWFEQQLLDYDVASNWGNWSYFSGVGSDPRDRAFNTETQAKHYDPEGLYRKRWLQ